MRFLKLALLAFVLHLLSGAPSLLAQNTMQAATPTTIATATQLAVPTITTVEPATGARGSSISVTLTGTDFEAGMTVNAGAGIAVSNVGVTNSTTATATFAIASAAGLGQRKVTVTTEGGTSNEKIFTVVSAPPTFAGITPAAGSLGGTINVTLTGTNFVSGLVLNVGANITVRNLSVLNSSMATATLSIDSTAEVGFREFTVTTSGGESNGLAFSVLAAPLPTLTAISPATGVQGSILTITLSGTNFITGLAVEPIDGITVTSINVISSISATAIFTIASDAALGPRDVTVTTAGGTSGPAKFSIADVLPTLTGISPSGGAQGTAVTVILSGSSFATGLSVESIPGITVSNLSVTNSTTLRATFTMDAGAELGPREVRVTTSGGTSGLVTFTVLPPSPTLTGISPTSGGLGTAVAATLTGTNFYAPLTIAVGPDIAVSNISVIDSATASATFTIGLGAAPGLQNVTITTPGGSASAAVFSVLPFPPTLTSLSPASAIQGSLGRSFLVTLTGTNLFDPTIAISGTGVRAPFNVYVTSGTTGTAGFTVDGDAALGPRDVTVTTAGGTSNPLTFTVLPPTPTLTSIAPAVGVRGTSVNVTISGTNFSAGNTTLNIPGVTVTNLAVANGITLTATFTIPANMAVGVYDLTATTSQGTTNSLGFRVADPFPDLSIISMHSGKFGVGFNEPYTVTVSNNGQISTSGPITVSENLPPGLTFVSGVGPGWSCVPNGQIFSCTNSTVLAVGASSTYTLTVQVGTTAASAINHTVSVTTPGDLNSDNNSATDPTTIAPTPTPTFVFSPSPLVAGEQATVAARVLSTFPHDVTGIVTLEFVSSAVIPVDDPAIQFATGGKTVAFTIPANSTQARFGSTSTTALGFQTGTVAGRLIFKGTFTAGNIQGSFSPPVGSSAPTIPSQAPVIKSIETTTQGGFVASVLFFSTPREVTELSLTFNTNTKIKLSCGVAAGCSANGNTITFNVASAFAAWFASDTTYGSLGLLRLPLNIDGGSLKGTVDATLKNKQGLSNVVSFDLAPTVRFGG